MSFAANSHPQLLASYMDHLENHREKVLFLQSENYEFSQRLKISEDHFELLKNIIENSVDDNTYKVIYERLEQSAIKLGNSKDNLNDLSLPKFRDFNNKKVKMKRNNSAENKMIEYVSNRIRNVNEEIIENFKIIKALEEELEAKDLLCEKQNQIIMKNKSLKFSLDQINNTETSDKNYQKDCHCFHNESIGNIGTHHNETEYHLEHFTTLMKQLLSNLDSHLEFGPESKEQGDTKSFGSSDLSAKLNEVITCM